MPHSRIAGTSLSIAGKMKRPIPERTALLRKGYSSHNAMYVSQYKEQEQAPTLPDP